MADKAEQVEERKAASMLPPQSLAFYKKAEENFEGFWEEAAQIGRAHV